MKKIKIRKAVLKDANKIKKIVDNFASKGQMLSVSFNYIYEKLRDFWIIEENGKIVGCGSLKIIWKDLGEIRSLAITPSKQKKGYGKRLVKKIFQEGKKIGIKKIFVLTYVPEFFEKFGFIRIPKSKLPHKIWFDCINCPKFPKCDEVALIKNL